MRARTSVSPAALRPEFRERGAGWAIAGARGTGNKQNRSAAVMYGKHLMGARKTAATTRAACVLVQRRPPPESERLAIRLEQKPSPKYPAGNDRGNETHFEHAQEVQQAREVRPHPRRQLTRGGVGLEAGGQLVAMHPLDALLRTCEGTPDGDGRVKWGEWAALGIFVGVCEAERPRSSAAKGSQRRSTEIFRSSTSGTAKAARNRILRTARA